MVLEDIAPPQRSLHTSHGECLLVSVAARAVLAEEALVDGHKPLTNPLWQREQLGGGDVDTGGEDAEVVWLDKEERYQAKQERHRRHNAHCDRRRRGELRALAKPETETGGASCRYRVRIDVVTTRAPVRTTKNTHAASATHCAGVG